jgi:hypothetical protein
MSSTNTDYAAYDLCLEHLKLCIIVDDYGDPHRGSRQAVDEYRKSRGISEGITKIDWTGVCCRRPIHSGPRAAPLADFNLMEALSIATG